jgi:hypothetical protein
MKSLKAKHKRIIRPIKAKLTLNFSITAICNQMEVIESNNEMIIGQLKKHPSVIVDIDNKHKDICAARCYKLEGNFIILH